MSLQELLPGSFGLMFPAFALPMKAERSRNKERLEASLAGLCELELLKQRQECRVLSALCLGDVPLSGRPPWGSLRSARCALDATHGTAAAAAAAAEDFGPGLQSNSLQPFPPGVKSSLEQQVAELKVNAEVKSAEPPPTDLEDKRLGSGEVLETGLIPKPASPEFIYLRSFSAPEATVEADTGVPSWQSVMTRQTSVTDSAREMRDIDLSLEDYQQAQKAETYIFGLVQRRVLPTRPSKPRTSLAHDSRAVTLVRQSSLCHKEEQHSAKQVSSQMISSPPPCTDRTVPQACLSPDQERYLGMEFNEDTPPPYHHLQSVQHPTGFYPKPRPVAANNTSGSTSPEYTPLSVLQVQDSSNSENSDSLQHFHNYHPQTAQPKPQHPTTPDEHLVNAEYIPAQPCQASTRAYAHHHSNPHKGSGVAKSNRNQFSPERTHQEQQPTASQVQPAKCRGGPKKCRLNEEKSSGSRKPGKKACRSQSENSLQRAPERKYNTVERDGGGSGSGSRGSRGSQSKSKKQQQGSGSYRRWQSTLELSQDEAEQPPVPAPAQAPVALNQRDNCARRTRKSRSTQPTYAYPHRSLNHHHHHHQSHHHHQHVEYHCKPREVYARQAQGDSESSTSEADSPDSSTLSSDSDESGGLVWPQQLPPQHSLPSPPAPSGAPLQPKAFVKIKASHALKKKILRFRTGSLKVMTTV